MSQTPLLLRVFRGTFLFQIWLLWWPALTLLPFDVFTKIPRASMVGRAESQVCADQSGRTPICTSEIVVKYLFRRNQDRICDLILFKLIDFLAHEEPGHAL